MIVIVYLLLITACFAYVYSKKRKWLTWTVGVILSVVTGLCVIIIYNGKILIPSTHKNEIKLITADNFVKVFNEDMSYRTEISFEKYIYKVRQDELKFKEKALYTSEDCDDCDNIITYRVYRFEDENEASEFIPRMLFQKSVKFRGNSGWYYLDTTYDSPPGDISKYPSDIPKRLINSFLLDGEFVFYYLPTVLMLYDLDWFMVFGTPPGVSYHSACAIKQGNNVIMFFEDSQTRKSELSEAVNLLVP
ncbi:MAG: hypothetical protein ACOX45_10025 [Acutalibacteraceae bacterium]